MIDRKPLENGSNPGSEREEAVLRGVSGWLEPSEPWLARRNGISSAFRSRHMGNVGQEQHRQKLQVLLAVLLIPSQQTGCRASTMDASEGGNNG
jgi:hypothetical protein